jgi:hypothetical protein
VIVSPWIPRETIVNDIDFDHSSVPATIKKVFALPAFLTKRDAAANTFEGVASLASPRADTPLRFRTADDRHVTEWGDEVTDLHRARMLMATGDTSSAPISDLQLDIVALARERAKDSNVPEVAVLDLMRPMLTEHDAAIYLREAAARIRSRQASRAHSLRVQGEDNLDTPLDVARRRAIADPGAAEALHVTQDDHGYWRLSVERRDGSLKLLEWQAMTADQLIENAYQLVIGGRYPEAVVLVDPPRRRESRIVRAASALDSGYSKPLPRKAGLN